MSQNRNQFKLGDSQYRRIKNFHQDKNATIQKENVKKETIFLCEMLEKLYIDGPTLKLQKEKLCNYFLEENF